MEYVNALYDSERAAQRARETWLAANDALLRLIDFTERSDAHQALLVARFLAYLLSARPLFVDDLKFVEDVISDDMLICIEAARWGDVTDLVPDARSRCIEACKTHGLFSAPIAR